MKTFVKVIKASEVKRGEARLIYVSDIAIAIFNAGGAFYATQDYCTGDGGSLSEGILSGTEIQCAGDKARFYLPTGDCTHPLGFKPLQTYRVRVDGDDITIELREDIREELRREKFTAGYTAFQSIG